MDKIQADTLALAWARDYLNNPNATFPDSSDPAIVAQFMVSLAEQLSSQLQHSELGGLLNLELVLGNRPKS